MTTPHDFGDVLGRPLDMFFWVSQLHGHGSWIVCEVALGSQNSSSMLGIPHVWGSNQQDIEMWYISPQNYYTK